MKTAKVALIIAGCAAIPAFAQSGTPMCGVTNFDASRGLFTITSPAPGGNLNQQCFVTVVSKAEWAGGPPNLARSELVEGNYEISASGGGGGGGGSARSARGYDGADAIPLKHTRYLTPGVYRLTIGTGGPGGQACLAEDQGGRGGDGAPTSLSEAYTGQTIAGFPRAESWDGTYPVQVAAGRRVSGAGAAAGNMTPAARSGELGGGGRGAGSGSGDCTVGANGGNGFIKLAFADPAPQAPRAAEPPRAQPAPATEVITTPPPVDVRPARRDRN